MLLPMIRGSRPNQRYVRQAAGKLVFP